MRYNTVHQRSHAEVEAAECKLSGPERAGKADAMKRVLLLLSVLLCITRPAMADHFGIYSDATGTECVINSGFTGGGHVYVIHQFANEVIGSSFGVTLPAGSMFFGFQTPYDPIPVPGPTAINLVYPQCTSGTLALGTIIAILTPGQIQVTGASGLPIVYDCSSQQPRFASAGTGWVGVGDYCDELPTQQSTWGQVKALYR